MHCLRRFAQNTEHHKSFIIGMQIYCSSHIICCFANAAMCWRFNVGVVPDTTVLDTRLLMGSPLFGNFIELTAPVPRVRMAIVEYYLKLPLSSDVTYGDKMNPKPLSDSYKTVVNSATTAQSLASWQIFRNGMLVIIFRMFYFSLQMLSFTRNSVKEYS